MSTIIANRSDVFKAAWNLVKTAQKTLSEALKSAWSEFKAMKDSIKNLTDEQLKERVFESLQEAFERGEDIGLEVLSLYKVFQDKFQDYSNKAAEKARKEKIEAEAQAEAEKQKKLWEEKKQIAQRLIEILGTDDVTINVWGTTEKRIYLNTTTKGRKDWKGKEIATLFYTGNAYNKPMTLKMNISITDEKEEELKQFLITVGNSWKGLLLDVAKAL